MFEIELQSLETPALSLDYFAVPWDTELMALPTAQIKRIVVRDYAAGLRAFDAFSAWKDEQQIAFCTAKIPHHSTPASYLIQERGYRFVELNYRPEIRLDGNDFDDHSDFEFHAADRNDMPRLCEIAGSIFRHTRFHLDPLLPAGSGNRRYAAWMANAFDNPGQRVIKCMKEGQLTAFFVLEQPEPHEAFWSLVGLAPEQQGRGLARPIWTAALGWLARQGVTRVSTSISSLNSPVVNLYAGLGFRFPVPEMTFHWHRSRQSR